MKVLLFARARDLVGADHVEIEGAATVADLRRQLKERFPNHNGLLDKCAVAINDEFADDDSFIPPGAEVALLPPVSGG
jgi:molybdopterin converting factor subunit 1